METSKHQPPPQTAEAPSTEGTLGSSSQEGSSTPRSSSLRLWEQPLSTLHEIGAGGFGRVLVRAGPCPPGSPHGRRSGASSPRTSGPEGFPALRTCLKVGVFPKKGSDGLLREFRVLQFLKQTSEGEPFYPLAFRYVRLVDEGRECIEMERLQRPLSELTRRAQKAPPEQPSEKLFRSVAAQAVRCLFRLHGAGIYHGDVKPRNFMFDSEGALRLVDFGLSQFLRLPPRDAGSMAAEGASLRFQSAGARRQEAKTRARFEGTTKYCSPRVHEKQAIHPADDYVSLLYFLWEWFTQTKLPWNHLSSRQEVLALKKKWLGWNDLPRPLAMLYHLCQSPRLFRRQEVARLLALLEANKHK